jgi:Domain of unknown function (DUF4249)
MKQIKIYAVALLTNLFFMACDPIENYETAPPKAVVTAYLSPNKVADVYINKELPFTDESNIQVEPLSNLTVKLTFDGQTKTLKWLEKGHYQSDFKTESGKTYKLSFDYNGKVVSAETTIPSRPTGFKASVSELQITGGFPPSFPDPVKLTWDNAANDYHLAVATNIEPNPEVVTSGFGGNTTNLSRQFRSNPSRSTSTELIGPNFQYYGRYDLILYKINGEYASLYENNGSSSINLTAPFTNVENGLGIFTGIASDTLRLTVKK